MRGATLLFATLATASSAAVLAEQTEYAFRWNPAEGGPKTASGAASELNIQADRAKEFEVRYLTVKQPPGLPSSTFRAVARERTDKGGPESMYKVRGPYSDAAAKSLSSWSCPLSGPNMEQKLEVDINWAIDEAAKKKNPKAPPTPHSAISFSCSVDGAASTSFPKDSRMSPKPCANKVLRLKAKTWKVEEWDLAAGGRIVELSYSVDAGSSEHQAAFQENVDKLLKAGSLPLPASKELLGSDCQTKVS